MKFSVITLFPDLVTNYCSDSILARAQEKKLITVQCVNPRSFTKDKHHRVDQRPYAGGPGMVLEAEPFLKAIEKAKGKSAKQKVKILFFAPGGKEFTNSYARSLVKKYDHIIMIAGRYEGVDARVKKIAKAESVSVGPYVLTGGEVPSMIVIDAVSRQIKGVLGKFDSLEEERTASQEVYTRPEVLVWKKRKYRVPKVLLSGDHKKIESWRLSRISKGAPGTSQEGVKDLADKEAVERK
jgi:tRNA (guanine37-N1)-methyltransferase